jgi:hypothetical protein
MVLLCCVCGLCVSVWLSVAILEYDSHLQRGPRKATVSYQEYATWVLVLLAWCAPVGKKEVLVLSNHI